MDDLTIIYYTANRAKPHFTETLRKQLVKAAGGIPIICVSQEPLDFGEENICVGNIGHKTYNIYRQLLIGAKAANTKYVATAEDDVLYPYEHYHSNFPADGVFQYDMNRWSMFTWSDPPVFTYREGRAVLHQLICCRDDLIDAIEDRFARYPDEDNIPVQWFGEPGRYEKYMGITVRTIERFASTGKPSIVFSHPEACGWRVNRDRKRYGKQIVTEIPGWGTAQEVISLYRNGAASG
jgi:hypothetical protein